LYVQIIEFSPTNRKISGFDWDDGNRRKCLKHGVSMVEIEQLFEGAPRIAPDVAHSALEDRLIAVGRTLVGRALFVAFTFRIKGEAVFIRPVSARYMHRKEIEAYEKKNS
jgi:uncharacterized DUF497 family protein